MKVWHLAVLTFALLTGLTVMPGCSSEPEISHAKDTHATGESEPRGIAVQYEDANGKISDTPPEKASGLSFIPLAKLPYEEVEIPVSGQSLYGRLYDPFQKPENDEEEEEEAAEDEEDAAPTQKYPLVILLHALNGSFRDWDQLPARLVGKGYAVLAVDMRGHGNSAPRGRSWRNFSRTDWLKLPDDLRRILLFFTDSEDYPQVDGTRTAIIGASIGANTAIIAGSRNTKNIRALVALSAGREYKGLEITTPIYDYHNALLMVASQNDAYAFESTQLLYRLPRGPKTLQLYKNIGHGTDMIRFFPELQATVTQWLVDHFPPTPAPILYPDEDEEGEE